MEKPSDAVKKHANLSIFVPHAGCSHRCSFCNQTVISGEAKLPTAPEVTALCDAHLPAAGSGENTEIAFFGGSFTAIDRDYMESLLAAAAPFVASGRAAGIRISTRPDAVDPAVLALLKSYGVSAIELGAQSMSDTVLRLNRRGHTSLQVAFAARLCQNAGFSLGLQMMTGLYGETHPARSARDTAIALANLRPDTVRIYPALVLRDTYLAQLMESGAYRPQTLQEAVDAVAPLLDLFEQKGIRVIRVGLHDEPGLAGQVLAGPYHPAFRQLCEAQLYRRAMEAGLAGAPEGSYTAFVAKGQRSTAAGQKNETLAALAAMGYQVAVCERDGMSGRELTMISSQEEIG